MSLRGLDVREREPPPILEEFGVLVLNVPKTINWVMVGVKRIRDHDLRILEEIFCFHLIGGCIVAKDISVENLTLILLDLEK